MRKNTLNMTEGSVVSTLLLFTVPIFVSNLFQQLYNVVDVAVIGHILADQALAAVGATSAIYSLVVGFINGMSNGFCVIIARYFGGNEEERFHRAVNLSILLTVLAAAVLTLACRLVLRTVLGLLNTPEEILELSYGYISAILLFCCVTFAYNLLSSMLRAIGNSYIPLYALILASVLNVVLDLLFVRTMGMGVKGAAYATVIAQGFSVLFQLVYILKCCPLLRADLRGLTPDPAILSELLSTGFSMAMMLVLTNVGSVILQSSINSFGTATITGHTAARKFHDLCMLPLGTICTASATFVSQNYGARKKERIGQGIRAGLLLGSAWSAFVLLVVLLFGAQLIRLLTGTSDAEAVAVAMKYLYWNVPFYAVLNVLLVMRNSLQALGDRTIPVVASSIEMAGKFAGAFLLSGWIGYLGVCLTEPISWIACGALVMAGFRKRIRQLNESTAISSGK